MNNLIEQTALKYGLFEYGDKIIVALSGGADSVCLLDSLVSLKEKYNLTIFAAHLNHNLRGEEAKRDEVFCKFLCEKYNVKLFIKNSDIKLLSAEQKISEELCGRNERYAFFKELSDTLDAKTATAHTASDNAETLIFNLVRGASIDGICAIPPKRGRIIRPLIETTRAQIEKYCSDKQLEFVTDSSNLTDDYTRNNIRHNIIPLLKKINPSFEKSALNLSSSAREISDFLSRSAENAIETSKTEFGYDCKILLSFDKAVLKKTIIILCKKYNISLEQRHISLLCKIIENGGSLELSKSCTAVSKQGIFRIVTQNVNESFCPIKLESNMDFTYNCKRYYVEELSDDPDINTVNAGILTQNAVFRTRRQGDVFTYPKRRITKPLRKVLNEQKIPSELRDKILVLAAENTVFWCENIGTSLFGLPKSNGKSLKIKIEGCTYA